MVRKHDWVYLFTMKSRMTRPTWMQAKLTFRGISTTRKHLYFYVLLFLTTAVVHNIWQSLKLNQQPALESHLKQMQEVSVQAKRMTP